MSGVFLGSLPKPPGIDVRGSRDRIQIRQEVGFDRGTAFGVGPEAMLAVFSLHGYTAS